MLVFRMLTEQYGICFFLNFLQTKGQWFSRNQQDF